MRATDPDTRRHMLGAVDWDAVLAGHRAEMDADYWGSPVEGDGE